MPKQHLEPWQSRAGRAALQWTAKQLAEAAEASVSSVMRLEAGEQVSARMRLALRTAFEGAGVTFAEDGWMRFQDRAEAE